MSDNALKVPVTNSDTPVNFFKRTSKGKSSLRKRAPTPPAVKSDGGSDYSSSEETVGPVAGRRIKKRKTGITLTASSLNKPAATSDVAIAATTYTATSRSIVSNASNEATKLVDWFDEDRKDKQVALFGHQHQPNDGDLVSSEPLDLVGGIYKGTTASYGSFITKSEKAAQRSAGPLKASSNVRTITITDYAPDVCKDYKQTGFCGFGDTCKFLHAREDYAAGWKLDREWEIGQNGKRKKQEDEEQDEEYKELKDIPFKCVICKDDYKYPITTKCAHYFCEGCAIKKYKKNPGCAICGKRTDGVFNAAKNLRKKLERKQIREDEKKAKEEDEQGCKK